MGRVKGVKERLHMPIYDAFFVQKDGARNTFESAMTDLRLIRFFVDVQNKTKLETNLQASGVLPSQNSFECRALRVIASLPRKDVKTEIEAAGFKYAASGKAPVDKETLVKEVLAALPSPDSFLTDLIYYSVTSLLVGEKVMIEVPTFYFPAGAGVNGGNGTVINHGEPDPMATFRFAEPVIIEPNQNFRVEMLFPQGVPDTLRPVKGPLRVWVALDGYLTRDVQ